jgi:hypothetical protein
MNIPQNVSPSPNGHGPQQPAQQIVINIAHGQIAVQPAPGMDARSVLLALHGAMGAILATAPDRAAPPGIPSLKEVLSGFLTVGIALLAAVPPGVVRQEPGIEIASGELLKNIPSPSPPQRRG